VYGTPRADDARARHDPDAAVTIAALDSAQNATSAAQARRDAH